MFVKISFRTVWRGVLALSTVVYIASVLIYDNPLSIHGEQYGLFPLFLLSAISGTFMAVSFCAIITDRFKGNFIRAINFAGQTTIVFYAFQSKGIRIVQIVIGRIGLELNTYIKDIAVALLVFVMLFIPAYVINRFFPFMLGKFELPKKIKKEARK